MPIYEYRCTSCGHQQEFLQKVTAPPVTVCTACGKPTFSKMLTAAGFQLKGSGWYATDFLNKPAAAPAGGEAKAPASDAAKAEAKPEAKAESAPKTETKGDAKSGGAAS
jgi:putative FmdB family regulatory protein